MSILGSLISRVRSLVQHYDHDKYWTLREKITKGRGNKFLCLFCLYKIKAMDAKNCASTGTHLEKSAFLHLRQIFHTVCME